MSLKQMTLIHPRIFIEVDISQNFKLIFAKYNKFTNPIMHLSHILQKTIQTRSVHISVLN